MQYFMILLCAALSCAKVTIQGCVAKGNIKNATDAVLTNGLIFAFICVFFAASCKSGIHVSVLPYAALFGTLGVFFQILYSLALESGPFSATCMLVNLNMIVPVIFSLIVYHEKVTVPKVFGIVLCLVALFLNVRSDGKKVNLKWCIYVLLAFFSTGIIGIVQKVFARSPSSEYLEQFLFFGYLIACGLSWVLYFFLRKAKQERNLAINRKNLILILLIAATLAGFQFFYTFTNSFVDAIILVPSVGGLATVMQMMAGRILFREKFTPRQICSICFGITAILLISL